MWTLQPLLTTDRPGATLEAMKRFDIAEWKAKREQEGEILLTTEQVAEMRGSATHGCAPSVSIWSLIVVMAGLRMLW